MPSIELFKFEPATAELAAGDLIFKEGDSGNAMFAILEGRVEIVKADKVLITLEPGDVFGEMALIEHTPRSATAVAKTPCRLVAINAKRFMYLVQHSPFFAIQMMQVLSERLRRHTES